MSNHDDFWTTLATGHTNTVLAHGMDRHLGTPFGDRFEGVRVLSDVGRAAHALPLPVAVGVKVSFAGTLGALMAHDDVPADGAIGEVVTVKSATGEITHHDGKVFVKWEDGKFRPIHAVHLRRAAQKTAATTDVHLDQVLSVMLGKVSSRPDKGWIIGPPAPEDAASGPVDSGYVADWLEWGGGAAATVLRALAKKGLVGSVKGRTRKNRWYLTSKGLAAAKRVKKTADESQDKEVAELLKAKPDNEFLQSVEDQLGEDRSLSDKQEEVLDEIREEVKSDKSASFRVGTLGDLTDFLKVAEGKLIHTSTADLWSYTKDAEGAFLVSRLFDDMGDPLKG